MAIVEKSIAEKTRMASRFRRRPLRILMCKMRSTHLRKCILFLDETELVCESDVPMPVFTNVCDNCD